MLVKSILDNCIKDTVNTLSETIEPVEKQQLKVLIKLLESNSYLVRAMGDTFTIEDAPEDVYLFDKERNMFWKGRNGYTMDIYSAGFFNLKEARKIVSEDYKNNTKIVYFGD